MNELTREQILSMSAQELAEATAVHVMGWVKHEDAEIGEYYHEQANVCGVNISAYVVLIDDWNPAEDIAAAWEVEGKIKELSGGEKGLIIRYMTRLMNVVGEDGFDMLHATPEQRCKAALLAVMGL